MQCTYYANTTPPPQTCYWWWGCRCHHSILLHLEWVGTKMVGKMEKSNVIWSAAASVYIVKSNSGMSGIVHGTVQLRLVQFWVVAAIAKNSKKRDDVDVDDGIFACWNRQAQHYFLSAFLSSRLRPWNTTHSTVFLYLILWLEKRWETI